MPRSYQIVMVVVALFGFADAMYLTAHHYFGIPLVCGPFSGCETVTSSVYSEFFGIPVALFGALYYVTLFGLLIFALEFSSRTYFKLACAFTLLGFLFSCGFVFIMAFILQAWCTYCLLSAISSTVLFILGMYALWKMKYESLKT